MFWSDVKAHETHNFWTLNDEEEEKKKKRARFNNYFLLTGRKYLKMVLENAVKMLKHRALAKS